MRVATLPTPDDSERNVPVDYCIAEKAIIAINMQTDMQPMPDLIEPNINTLGSTRCLHCL